MLRPATPLLAMLDSGPFPGGVARFYRAVVILAALAAAGTRVGGTVEGWSGGHGLTAHWVEAAAASFLLLDLVLQVYAAIAGRQPGIGRAAALRGYATSLFGLIDLCAALPLLVEWGAPLPHDLVTVLGVVRLLKVARYLPALETVASVIRREARPLQSALYIMVLLMMLSSTIAYLLERDVNPAAFASIPQAMWWSVVTLTTLGYGDAVPVTAGGKVLGGLTAVLGLGMFALPASILATGFSEEMRRRDFLTIWHMVAKVPFFSSLDAEQIASITGLLKFHTAPAGDVLIRNGDVGDAMYFIVNGTVEADFGGIMPVLLKDGDFFGEIALLRNSPRTATVRTRNRCQLLMLDVKDFKQFLGGSPAMAGLIAETANRRLSEQAEQLMELSDPVV